MSIKAVISRTRSSGQVKAVIFTIAFMLVGGGVVFSVWRNPQLVTEARWEFVGIVLFVGVPLALLFNSLRYYFTARLILASSSLTRSVEIATVGTAANMLPLPGGTLVRLAALSRDAQSLKSASKATLLITHLWVAVTLSVAGIGIAVSNQVFGYPILAVGVLGVIATPAALMLFRFPKLDSRQLWHLVLVEVASALVESFRFWLCLRAIGVTAELDQAAALIIASLAGSAVSIVPAGLGVREVVAALTGPLVGLSPEACFVSAALNRVIGLAGIAPVAGAFVLKERRVRGRADDSASNRAV